MFLLLLSKIKKLCESDFKFSVRINFNVSLNLPLIFHLFDIFSFKPQYALQKYKIYILKNSKESQRKQVDLKLHLITNSENMIGNQCKNCNSSFLDYCKLPASLKKEIMKQEAAVTVRRHLN